MNNHSTPARVYAEGIGEAVADRTINRIKPDGTRETWADVAHRVAVGNSLLCPSPLAVSDEYHAMNHHLRQASLLMSGRHLQHGDETQPDRNQEVFTNCSTAAASFVLFYLLLNGSGVGRSYDDQMMVTDWRNLPEVFITVDRAYPDRAKGMIPEGTLSMDEAHELVDACDIYVVEDSREGWAHAVEYLESLAYSGHNKPVIIDFSQVRPHGSPIKGMQNRPSSGPGPTMLALQKIVALRDKELAPWKQAMFVDHYLAESVLVGGARRAARMATKDWRDETVLEFVRIKKDGGLWSSNNSVTVDEEFWHYVRMPASAIQHEDAYVQELWGHAKEVFEAVCHHSYFDQTGEPGLINQDKLTAKMDGIEVYDTDESYLGSAKFQPREYSRDMLRGLMNRFKESRFKMITNPCGEITLTKVGGYCVIADVVPYHAQNLDDAHDAFRVATRALIRTNLMDCLYRKEVDRTNRIGVGITGFHEFAYKFFGYGFRDLIDEAKSQDFWQTIASFKRAVTEEAYRYATELDVTVPHTDTTIKPAGTTSKLFGLSEGAHLPAMREYLRFVQFRSDDPLIDRYRAAGYPTQDLVKYAGTTIVGFPTVPEICKLGMGDRLITAAEATPEEQYQYLRLMEKYWIRGVYEDGLTMPESGNQVSYTLKYDPMVVSYEDFRETLLNGQSSVRCCSVMPMVDASAYEYQPETPVTPEEFQEILSKIERGQVKEEVAFEHIDCGSGACPIDFNEAELEQDAMIAKPELPGFLVFSTKVCPACKIAKQMLADGGYEFTEVDVQNAEGFEFLRNFTGTKTVPFIVHGNKAVGGLDSLKTYLGSLEV